MNSHPTYGDFGNLTSNYVLARQQFPQRVIELLFESIDSNTELPFILDVGCGTGIATRQLAK